MNTQLLLGVLLVIGFMASRILLAIPYRAPESDVYGHAYFGRLALKKGAGIYGPIYPRVIDSKPYYQPLLINWIFARFGLPNMKYQRMYNAIIDMGFIGLLVPIALAFDFSVESALLVAGIYTFTPSLFTTFSGSPRLYAFTPRAITEVSTSLFFIFALFRVGSMSPVENLIYFLITLVLAGFVISSSKFGTQALILISLVYGALSFDLGPLAAVISSMILMVVFSRGRVVQVWKAHYKHLAKEFEDSRLSIGIYGRPVRSWFTHSKRTLNVTTEDASDGWRFFEAAKSVFKIVRGIMAGAGSKNYFNFLFFFPVGVVVALLALGNLLSLAPFEWSPMSKVVVATLLVFLVVSTKSLSFVGEAHRYLNHVAPIFVMVFLKNIDNPWGYGIAAALVSWGLVSYSFEFLHLWHKQSDQKDYFETGSNVVESIRSLSGHRGVAAVPYFGVVSHWRILFESSASVLLDTPYLEKKARLKDRKSSELRYSELTLEAMRAGFNVLIVDRNVLKDSAPRNLESEISSSLESSNDDVWEKIMESDRCRVYAQENES